MTNEERTAKLAELRAEAEAGAVEWNTANLEHRFADASHAAEKIDTAVKEYTALARMMCFEHCKNADDPMLEAVSILPKIVKRQLRHERYCARNQYGQESDE